MWVSVFKGHCRNNFSDPAGWRDYVNRWGHCASPTGEKACPEQFRGFVPVRPAATSESVTWH